LGRESRRGCDARTRLRSGVPARGLRGRGRKLDYRCAGEPEAIYAKKGGKPEDGVDRACLCNGLISAVGQPQVRDEGALEPPIVTSGDDLAAIGRFLAGRTSYTAADVVSYLLPPA
jgi:hypothetical protein